MHLKSNSPLIPVLKNRNFRLLWSAGAISTTVEMAEVLTLGWLVLQLTGSPWQVALVGVCRTAISLISGAIGDRWDRRRIMLGAETVNTLVVSVVLVVLLTDSLEPWHLLVAAAIRGGARCFDHTCRRAPPSMWWGIATCCQLSPWTT